MEWISFDDRVPEFMEPIVVLTPEMGTHFCKLPFYALRGCPFLTFSVLAGCDTIGRKIVVIGTELFKPDFWCKMPDLPHPYRWHRANDIAQLHFENAQATEPLQ